MKRELILRTQKGEITQELYAPDGPLPEIYIDGIHGLAATGTIVKLNCYTREFQSSEVLDIRVMNCRLVMGIDTFIAISDFLKTHSEKMQTEMGFTVVKDDKGNVKIEPKTGD